MGEAAGSVHTFSDSLAQALGVLWTCFLTFFPVKKASSPSAICIVSY